MALSGDLVSFEQVMRCKKAASKFTGYSNFGDKFMNVNVLLTLSCVVSCLKIVSCLMRYVNNPMSDLYCMLMITVV